MDKNKDFSKVVDFVLHAKSDAPFKILQITDPQVLDASQSRFKGRLSYSNELSDEELYNRCFYYIEQAVLETKPDLILVTGDIVYGEFDDSGKSLERFVAFMERFDVLWAPIFGNHDNESLKGATWQSKQFENAKNCLFKQGTVTGNGNYTLGIEKDGKLVKVIFMTDSGGAFNAYTYCYMPSMGRYNESENVREENGFADDQIKWIEDKCKEIDCFVDRSVSKFFVLHIPIQEFAKAAFEKGYVSSIFWDNKDVVELPKNGSGDFGSKREYFSHFTDDRVWNIIKRYNFNGVFVGHSHKNSLSLTYEGVRLTYGLKAGTFVSFTEDMLGGTLITLTGDNGEFSVEHKYVPYKGL